MANQQVKVKALRPFAHGNITASAGGVYTMNRGDAQELEKAGFVELGATGESEATQYMAPAQKAQPGDVVVDDDADILGAKMDTATENKMAKAGSNKAGK